MSESYFLRSRGKVLGPFPVDRLLAMKARGQLGRTHQVSTDRQTWTAAAAVPDLFPAGPAPMDFEPLDAPLAPVAAAPVAAVGPQMGEAAWYYAVAGQQFGPVSAAELRSLLMSGELGPDDRVWRDGLEAWAAVQDVPELRSRSASASGTDRPGRRRRSAMAMTAMYLAIAPWLLDILGILTFFLAALYSRGERGIRPEDLVEFMVNGAALSIVLKFWWFALSVLAVIFGGIALSQITEPENRLTGYSAAMTGLVLGIVNLVLMVLFIPMALMFR